MDPDHCQVQDSVNKKSRIKGCMFILDKYKDTYNRTHFSLSNVHWQVVCGRRAATSRRQHLMKKMGLQPAIDELSQHSSRVATSAAYMEHLRAGDNETLCQSQGTQSMEVRVLPERTTCRQTVEQGSSIWLYRTFHRRLGQRRFWTNIPWSRIRTQQTTTEAPFQTHSSHTLE